MPSPEAEPEGDQGDQAEHGPIRRALDPLIRFHNDHPIYFWVLTVGLIAAVLATGSYLAPEIFLHEFLWRNFWGPTVTDAKQISTEVRYGIQASEDYTLLSEIVYGLILAGALTSIYVHLFKKRGIEVDGRFIASMLPYILFGPLARSLEDASVFCQASTPTLTACDPGIFSYVFISPFIYLLTAAAVITHLLLAHHSREIEQGTRDKLVGAWLGVQAFVYIAIWAGFQDQFTAIVRPISFVALCVVAYGVYVIAIRRYGGRHRTWAVTAWGLPMMLAPMILIGRWALASPWIQDASDLARIAEKAAPVVIPAVLAFSLIVVLALFAVRMGLERADHRWATYFTWLNLGLVWGHMVDGFGTFSAICSDATSRICQGATWLGIETSGYGEKHPVSEIFLSGFQVDWGIPIVDPVLNAIGAGIHALDGWGFPAMKLLLVGAIVVLIDRSAEQGDEDPTLVGLVKLAVLILGLAPGTRSVVRVALGV